MLLTMTTTHMPATDLGYLLHKHPDRCQSFDLSFGKAHVFYPEASPDRCTAALLLDVDPVGMVRNRRGPGGEGFLLRQYVNDRPYVASSLMSVAISRVFGTALGGRCEKRRDLVNQAIPLTARLSVLPCRGGEALLRRLFEPLGYQVTAARHPLDEQFPEWGESPYFAVELANSCRLQDLLAHLYVLIPVLDDDKHYWVGPDEVDKLLAKGGAGSTRTDETSKSLSQKHHQGATGGLSASAGLRPSPDMEIASEGVPAAPRGGRGPVDDAKNPVHSAHLQQAAHEPFDRRSDNTDTTDDQDKDPRNRGWLASHPERELIADRYLKHRAGLKRAALDRLVEEEDPDADEAVEAQAAQEEAVEAPLRLNDQRLAAVLAEVRNAQPKSVIDLGCGDGKLLRLLLQEKSIQRIVGMDVSYRSLEIAKRRLNVDWMPPAQRARLELIHGSLMYRDARLAGFDAATVVEVIEHLDPPRLAAFERVIFECARPKTVIVTTPNAEYNVRFETLPTGKFRHKDHRFEWTRAEFQAWANAVAERFGYTVRFAPIGPHNDEVGAPTQMCTFEFVS